jgi:hypothetical protein|tara:strand:+ start:47 stop:304 length:258 start_codon:yes stop_codon:yes gene_type:complete
MDKNKNFFIVERIKYEYSSDTYSIHDNSMYDLTTAVKKLLALDTLNENKKTSYHLQEVSFSVVQEPLILTKDMEVKNSDQQELPF